MTILTIAIPIYNMEQWLSKNLATYCDSTLIGRLEILCLNNASTDRSREIIDQYVQEYPQMFTLINRNSRGYGGSINEAIHKAQGMYFRIVDADDWVDTQELIKEINAIEDDHYDIVLTDYQIVNMEGGAARSVLAKEFGVEYGVEYRDFSAPRRTLPSIHGITYRTELLRESRFQMQDNTFFVDEEYVVLPYLRARNMIYYPFNVYRYQIANPEQSTSPKNRGKYQEHRERVLKRLITEYQDTALSSKDISSDALEYCWERIKRGIADHYTTLLIYVEDRKAGRNYAYKWTRYLKEQTVPIHCKGKRLILLLLNFLRITPVQYVRLKHSTATIVAKFGHRPYI